MAKSVFDAPQFKTEEGAFAYVEARLWPNGPVCPHCENSDGERIRKAANVHQVSSVTTVEAGLAAVQGLAEQANQPIQVRSLQEYHAR